MTKYGYTLFSELNGPVELVDQALKAEETGFDFAVISDHFHPWLSSHSDSPFAWSVLGAVASQTERMGLTSLVTCPFIRYHPAIIAQAAATIQILSGGRFTLGLGAGERLNEHVVGRGWPSVDVRHEMLVESVEAIRELWRGDFVHYRGQHITVEDAKLHTLPETPPAIGIAGSGQQSIELAVEHGDALIAIEPDPDLIKRYRDEAGPGARTIGQVALSYDSDLDRAQEQAMRFAFGVSGWKVMAELPNIPNFDAAIQSVRQEDVTELVACGPDPEVHVAAIQEFVDAGYDEVCVVQVADDIDGFFRFWTDKIAPKLAS